MGTCMGLELALMINSNVCYLLSDICYPEGTPIGSYTPDLDVYGSCFPAWLICLLVGVMLTILVSQIGRVLDLATVRMLGLLLPVSLILIFSITTWFLFFATNDQVHECQPNIEKARDRTVPPGHFATGYSLVLTFGINAPSVIIAGVGSVCGAAGSQYL